MRASCSPFLLFFHYATGTNKPEVLRYVRAHSPFFFLRAWALWGAAEQQAGGPEGEAGIVCAPKDKQNNPCSTPVMRVMFLYVTRH